MAKSAAIGNLFVNLGINSAEFSAGLKAAQTSLGKFGKATAVGLAAVTAAATAASVAIGVAVKGAIDHADELSKASQKIGVSVEALSRLEYAAQLSDVSLEQLTAGLRQFSKAIVEASTNGKSGPAGVFSALGIAVKDAAGNLRSNEQLFGDVAERFARMEDGALKTSIAMQLFGKSGSDLIPLLNSGRTGLADMAAEADRLGVTITGKTAAGAEAFNDTLTKIGAVLQGVTNKVMEAALPAMQSLADTLASPEFAAAAQTLATNLVGAFNAVVQAVVSTTNAISGFMDWLKSLDSSPGNGAPLINGMTATDKYNLGQNVKASSNYPGFAESLYRGFSFNDDGTIKLQQAAVIASTFTPSLEQGTEAAKVFAHTLDESIKTVDEYAREIGDGLAGAFSQFADAVMSGVPAIEALSDVLGNLGKQLLNSAISGFFTNLFAGTFGTIAGGAPIPKTGFIPGITGPKLFAAGGISNGPAIFGESGPEAAVPLPDGRTIPVTLTGGGGYIDVRVVNEVRNGNMIPVMTQVAGEVAGRKIKAEAPAAVAAAQRNRGMGG